MPSEEKQKINVWIPGSLWKQIGSLGYESPTKATIAAFEALVRQEDEGSKQEALGSSQEEFRRLQEEIGRYQEKVKDLEARPDPVTLVQLQARSEALQMVLEEKDKRIERLENDLNKAGQREEDLKQMHNNYMLQVQSLINQRALSAPVGSRTTKEETRKKQEETGSNQEENKPVQEKKESGTVQKEVKGHIEKICKNCQQTFFTENPRKETCSAKCRSAYSRKK